MFGDMDPSVGSQGVLSKAATAPGRMGAREASQAILSVFARPVPRWKRTVDISGALFGLAVFSLPFLLIAILIKTASRGPVFFKQERVGRLGQRFVMWKFRTMVVDNNTSSHQCYMADLISAEGAERKPMVKQEDSRRLIFLGKVLRATCLDEVPQLLNVLKGEMSLVGPRPPIPYEAEKYLRWHSNRFDTVPGMTGLWQVSGKNNLTFNEMVRLDIRYAKGLSFLRDVRILLRTPAVVISQVLGALSRYLPRESDHAEQETA
jgi:lipopolysaccharide/colanic/teichoic acid biosynthesis glycosyltransferase